MTGTLEIYRVGGVYRFRYRAGTGKVVATSTAYSTKEEAEGP